MGDHVCPVWMGYFLASPLRKLLHSPKKIVGPYVHDGMTVLDIGCAMGFFSLAMARMVGSNGKVVCVDMQERMIQALERRARKAGLDKQIQARLCSQHFLGLGDLNDAVDFALAFAVVHEVPIAIRLFNELNAAMKLSAKLLVAEPKGRVTEDQFVASISAAEQCGFVVVGKPIIRRCRAALMAKCTRPNDAG